MSVTRPPITPGTTLVLAGKPWTPWPPSDPGADEAVTGTEGTAASGGA